MAVRDLSPKRSTPSPPAMGAGQVETGRIDFRLVPLPPGMAARDVRTILLGREHDFFEADALAFEEPPECVAGYHDATFVKLRQQAQRPLRRSSPPASFTNRFRSCRAARRRAIGTG